MSATFVDDFVERRSPAWKELESLLADGKRLATKSPADISRVARLYRELTGDRVRAASAGVAPSTLHYLDVLTSRAHAALYDVDRAPSLGMNPLLEFPRALRKNAGFFGLSAALFFLPFTVCLVESLASAEFASRVLPLEVLEQMAEAYSEDPASGRPPGANAAMAGFYVYNNVGIAFRCFATGILFGLGSVFFLVYNGVVTGAILGHVIRTGGGLHILTFVAGHAPLELTAIVIAGGAGLALGHALVETNGKTRLGSLREQRRPIAAQVIGAFGMLLLAAGVEAFWSPSPVRAEVKWGVGATLLVVVAFYLVFAGRRANSAAPLVREPGRAR